jgi:hypothetical protein
MYTTPPGRFGKVPTVAQHLEYTCRQPQQLYDIPDYTVRYLVVGMIHSSIGGTPLDLFFTGVLYSVIREL